MEGKYLYRDINSEIGKHEHVIFNINDEFELRYKDVRKFGKMYLVPKDELNKSKFKDLGYEPWDKNITSDYLLSLSLFLLLKFDWLFMQFRVYDFF